MAHLSARRVVRGVPHTCLEYGVRAREHDGAREIGAANLAKRKCNEIRVLLDVISWMIS